MSGIAFARRDRMFESKRVKAEFAYVPSERPTTRPPSAQRELGRRYAPSARIEFVTASLRNDPRSGDSDEDWPGI